MESIWDLCAIIFYMLLFIWGFYKINNIILINKMRCKEISKEIRNELNKENISKKIMRSIKLIFIFVCVYIFCGMILILFGSTFFICLTLMSGTSIIIKIFSFVFKMYIKSLIIILILPYIISFLLLLRGIYINKILKDKLNIIKKEEKL